MTCIFSTDTPCILFFHYFVTESRLHSIRNSFPCRILFDNKMNEQQDRPPFVFGLPQDASVNFGCVPYYLDPLYGSSSLANRGGVPITPLLYMPWTKEAALPHYFDIRRYHAELFKQDHSTLLTTKESVSYPRPRSAPPLSTDTSPSVALIGNVIPQRNNKRTASKEAFKVYKYSSVFE